MPIAGMLADERVNSPGHSQPATNERIRVNIGIIIVVDEVVADSSAENEPRYCDKKNVDKRDCGARVVPRTVRIFPFSHSFDSIEGGVLTASPLGFVVSWLPSCRNENRQVLKGVNTISGRIDHHSGEAGMS